MATVIPESTQYNADTMPDWARQLYGSTVETVANAIPFTGYTQQDIEAFRTGMGIPTQDAPGQAIAREAGKIGMSGVTGGAAGGVGGRVLQAPITNVVSKVAPNVNQLVTSALNLPYTAPASQVVPTMEKIGTVIPAAWSAIKSVPSVLSNILAPSISGYTPANESAFEQAKQQKFKTVQGTKLSAQTKAKDQSQTASTGGIETNPAFINTVNQFYDTNDFNGADAYINSYYNSSNQARPLSGPFSRLGLMKLMTAKVTEEKSATQAAIDAGLLPSPTKPAQVPAAATPNYDTQRQQEYDQMEAQARRTVKERTGIDPFFDNIYAIASAEAKRAMDERYPNPSWNKEDQARRDQILQYNIELRVKDLTEQQAYARKAFDHIMGRFDKLYGTATLKEGDTLITPGGRTLTHNARGQQVAEGGFGITSGANPQVVKSIKPYNIGEYGSMIPGAGIIPPVGNKPTFAPADSPGAIVNGQWVVPPRGASGSPMKETEFKIRQQNVINAVAGRLNEISAQYMAREKDIMDGNDNDPLVRLSKQNLQQVKNWNAALKDTMALKTGVDPNTINYYAGLLLSPQEKQIINAHMAGNTDVAALFSELSRYKQEQEKNKPKK